MLYLGEGAKWKGRRGLMLGSSDPNIAKLYLNLIMSCYDLKLRDFKFRIQHRADQNYRKLLTFWASSLGASTTSFYAPYIDKRTIGKPTLKPNYMGVCSISCAGTHIQLELEQIAAIICEAV